MKTGSGADRLPQIDVLRAFAALGVLVFHAAIVAGFPKRTLPPIRLGEHVLAGVPSPLSFGASGVNLFFVVSGICLGLQQWRLGIRAFRDPAIYARGRFARIVPAYWVAVAGSALVVALAGLQTPGWAAQDAAVHALFLHGFHPEHFLGANGALWSMATEVQFYFVFPLLVTMFSRLGVGRAVLLTGVFTLAVRLGADLLPQTSLYPGAISWNTLAAQCRFSRPLTP